MLYLTVVAKSNIPHFTALLIAKSWTLGQKPKNKKEQAVSQAYRLFEGYLYLRLRAASDFFLRFTEGFS